MRIPKISKLFKKEDYIIKYNEDGSVDGDDVLRSRDKESAFRKLTGLWLKLITAVSIIMVAYHMITARIGTPIIMKHRAIHVGFVLLLIWAYYPANKKSIKTKPSTLDIALMIITVVTTTYTIMNVEPFAARGGIMLPLDLLFGIITCLLVLEATRRVIGKGLLILAITFLLYAYLGKYIPGVFSHRGYTLSRIVYQVYLTGQGIFGVPIGVSAGYLVVFIVLAALLGESGLGKLFNDLSLALGGRAVGGPAKVSVMASALTGTIQGSAATNVATTGAFTIPLMKKVGYEPFFAGAVEAAASTGGQIMPPVMGTAAFIMAEFLGVSYIRIAIAAIIPSLLYFSGVFFQIDLRARKLGLRGLSKEELPDAKETIKKYGHMIIPIIILIYLLMSGRSPVYAAFYASISTWALSFVRRETRIGLKKSKVMCINAARNILSVAIAMACAGFIVAVLSMTGLGIILADNIVLLSKGVVFIALVLAMIVSIILGMGLPTSACYIIASTIAVPILTKMGIEPFQAHFFVLYFAVISTITPPVALSSYVAAGMSGASTNRVSLAAFKLALAAFIIPFFFIYNPSILLITDSNLIIIWSVITSLFGIFLLSASLEGYLFVDIPMWLRFVLSGASISFITPRLSFNIAGVALVSICSIIIYNIRKKKALDGVAHL